MDHKENWVPKNWCFFVCLFFLFYFIFKLYIIVLVLPNIKMNPPQVHMCSPSWTLLPPPSPRAAVLILLDSYSDATDFTEIPDCLVPGKSRNSQCEKKDLIKTTRGKSSYNFVSWRFGRMTLKHVKYHVRNELPVQVRCTILDAWG